MRENYIPIYGEIHGTGFPMEIGSGIIFTETFRKRLKFIQTCYIFLFIVLGSNFIFSACFSKSSNSKLDSLQIEKPSTQIVNNRVAQAKRTLQKPKKEIQLEPEPWQIGLIGMPGAGCTTLRALLHLLPPVSVKGDEKSKLADIRIVDCPENTTLASPPPGTLMALRKSSLHLHVLDCFSESADVSKQLQEIRNLLANLELLVINDRRRKKNTKTFWLAMGKLRAKLELSSLDKIEEALLTASEEDVTDYNDILDLDEQKAVQPIGLIGNKETFYILNICDSMDEKNILEARNQVSKAKNTSINNIFCIPIKSELELRQLPVDQQQDLRREYGLNSEELLRLCSAIEQKQPLRNVRLYIPFFLRKVKQADSNRRFLQLQKESLKKREKNK